MTGPGGVGKTTLSKEVGFALLDRLDNAVWFVDLASSAHAEDIFERVKETLGFREQEDRSWISSFQNQMAHLPGLLVLDNLEQVAQDAHGPLTTLLESVPTLKILCTSRKTMGLAGESVCRVSPLPSPRTGSTAAEVEACPSADLYLDRARSIVPGYVSDDHDSLGDLCRRLDGLPLALCLAASKADVMTTKETVEQLDERFKVLEAESDEFEGRHKQLWACIDWSYRLIPEAQSLFTDLAVFRGGWTIDSAVSVSQSQDVLSRLQTLRRHCLIEEVSRGRTIRFGMLESILEFARTKVRHESGAESRHTDYFLSLAVRALEITNSTERQKAFSDLDLDLENLKVAMGRALEAEPERALDVAVRLGPYAVSRGRQLLGLQWIERALDRLSTRLSQESAVKAHLCRAQLYRSLRMDTEGRAAINTCLSLTKESDVSTKIQVLGSLGGQYLNEGRLEDSLETFTQALELCQSDSFERDRTQLFGAIAVPLLMLGQIGHCEQFCVRAMSAPMSHMDPPSRSGILYTMAHVELMKRDMDSAQDFLIQSIEVLEEAGMVSAGFGRLTLLAELQMRSGAWDTGLETLVKSVDQLATSGMERDLADCATRAALWCENAKDYASAAEFLWFYEPYTHGFIGRSKADWRPNWSENLARVRQQLSASEWARSQSAFSGELEAMTQRIRGLGH